MANGQLTPGQQWQQMSTPGKIGLCTLVGIAALGTFANLLSPGKRSHNSYDSGAGYSVSDVEEDERGKYRTIDITIGSGDTVTYRMPAHLYEQFTRRVQRFEVRNGPMSEFEKAKVIVLLDQCPDGEITEPAEYLGLDSALSQIIRDRRDKQ
ncbi:hypothetical protein HY489_03290 [Candidatus Woesearchaeota archaeon]|nr:hypothetical protein [Candidatus Woesearchaeota archaeon]